jgi:aerobic carbon-monoxide dehydrogenase large subunit
MSLIGQPLTRREDPALLRGEGRYVDDTEPDGTLHAFFVRSPLAHALITGIDVTDAREAQGVVAVYTAADLAAQGVGDLPGGDGLPPEANNPSQPVLAKNKAMWAGQPVVMVIAETKEQAADAAEYVVVDYEDLPAVTAPLAAVAADAPKLHEESNVVIRRRLTHGDAAKAFQEAKHTVSQRMTSQRLAPVALEPRGVLAVPTSDGRLDIQLTTQRPHGSRAMIAKVLGVPVSSLRVQAGDVGGGFGTKGPLYPDQVAAIAAAKHLNKPVKWIEERAESFTATCHGRDQDVELELAADGSGKITAMRGTVTASMGAYLTSNGPGTVLGRLGPMLPQAYELEHFDVELVLVLANTTPIGPYRGAGRPEATYFTERLVDILARSMNVDPAQLRRRNFIHADAFPYTTVSGLTYDSGDYQAGLDLLLEKFPDNTNERDRVTSEGHLFGRGIATFVEPGGIVPKAPGPDGTIGDKATVTIDPDGKVTVAVGTSGHGQGHQTAFAQLAAALLDVPYDDVTVVFGDTDTAPFGYGTFGSRSLSAGGTAIHAACTAALDAAKRVDAPLPVAEAAARLGGITATGSSGAPPESYSSGAYGCDVAIDPETGQVTLLRVVAVDDCGNLMNPLLVEGQVQGAVAQGVGQVLSEHVAYDENGQPLAASLMDYAVPFAATLPNVESYNVVTPSPLNPLGVKGMGESGTIGVTPAMVNAVMDALAPYGIRHLDMPLTAEKIWRAIQDAPHPFV